MIASLTNACGYGSIAVSRPGDPSALLRSSAAIVTSVDQPEPTSTIRAGLYIRTIACSASASTDSNAALSTKYRPGPASSWRRGSALSSAPNLPTASARNASWASSRMSMPGSSDSVVQSESGSTWVSGMTE